MPMYLKRHLTWNEITAKHNAIRAQSTAEDERIPVVWKFGRTSHYTCGLVNGVESMYTHFGNGIISDEWRINDDWVLGSSIQSKFSLSGDSGSLVWDSDGYVLGLLWGGMTIKGATYITPMEFVLDDIREKMDAKVVHLVVRPEEGEAYPAGWHGSPIPPVAA